MLPVANLQKPYLVTPKHTELNQHPLVVLLMYWNITMVTYLAAHDLSCFHP